MALAQSPQQGGNASARADTPTPASSPFRRWTYTSLPWLRPVALLALLATFLSRVLAPALKGAGVLSTSSVDGVEFAGNTLAQLLLFALLTLLLSLALAVLQTPSLSLAFRLTFTALGGLALGLGAPASGAVLAPRLLGVLATSTSLMALLASGQALVHGPVRLVGLVLALLGTGALTRQGAWLLSTWQAPSPIVFLVSARWVAGAAFALHALAVMVALVWLATRRGRPFSLWTSAAMALSAALTFVVSVAAGGRGGPWAGVLGAGLYHLLQSPAPLVSLPLRYFIALLGPALAAVAALQPGRPASVRGALALMLIGGIDADVPLCALCLVVASLALVLAAFDGESRRPEGAPASPRPGPGDATASLPPSPSLGWAPGGSAVAPRPPRPRASGVPGPSMPASSHRPTPSPPSPAPPPARDRASEPSVPPGATLRSLSPLDEGFDAGAPGDEAPGGGPTARDTLPPKERPTIRGEPGVDFGPGLNATSYDGGDDDDAEDPFLGTTIEGRYVLESVIGIGGMGIVYAGRHVLINKRVAVKVLRSDMTRDREMLDRFRREAQAASSIGHPHIVDVSDYGQLPDGSAYLVMEYLEGRSLAHEMRTRGPLPAGQIVHVARQVADALAAAHALDIVHRDLKPDNVHLVARGADENFAKILDFGIAKMAGPGADRLTRAGTVFGTPHYMAPEQAAGTAVDHRTDIYSLGVILYEMVSGALPFDADNYMGILTQHMYKAPAPLRTLDSAPPPGLEAIVLKALAKRPEHRYQSMSELIEDLDRFKAGQVPEAVRDVLGNRGALAVPLDYFQGTAPGVSGGGAAEPRSGWARYAGLAAASLGVAALIPLAVLAFRPDAAPPAPAGSGAAAAADPPPARPAPPPPAPASAPPAPAPAAAGRDVIVTTVPENAELYVDGAKLGPSPISVRVPAGRTLTVEARHEGYEAKSVRVDDSKAHAQIRLARPHAPGGNARRPPPATSDAGRRLPAPDVGGPAPGDVTDPWSTK